MNFSATYGASGAISSNLNATHSVAKGPGVDHDASLQSVASLLQSAYDLAGELRGLGPAVHKMAALQGASIRQRLDSIAGAVQALQADLAEARGPLLARQLQNLGIDERSHDLQIHIGCGGHHLPGWINLDNYPAPLAVNLDWGIPLPDSSARFVFLSHLLEHLFHPVQSHRLLDEIRRVLKPGGIVRIVVPDIEQCIAAYVHKDAAFFAARRDHWTWLPEDMTRLESFLAYSGVGPTPEHLFEHHKFGYDFETLGRCLERVGFQAVRRCGFQASPHETLRVDHASSNASAQHGGGHYSLFVEAVRGAA
ncbi:MAG TPA: methyltransferase domain-containing protein [Steroidobacteraceae bacterium]|nr:methyltransferase domain-containing protein [Steroidobacteraceae bacterium]